MMHRTVIVAVVLAGVAVLGGAACSGRSARTMVMPAEAGNGPAAGSLDPLEVRRVTRAGRVQPPQTDDPNPPVTNPERAFLWRRLAWLDEAGQIAPGAYGRALAQREANLAAWGADGLRDAGISPGGWTARGPTNVGGRTRSLVIHPTQPTRMWAGSVSGGIWYSSNAGSTWAPVDDRLQNLAIGCLAMDPQTPDVMYAGTGEGYFNGDAIRGLGIYKSVDGGATWALMPATAGWENTCRIAVQPGNSQVILASRRYGGIYRSSDGGATWSQVLAAQGSFQVMFNPQDPQRAIGHIIDYSAGWFHRAVYSVNGGATWQTASGLNQLVDFNSRIELAMSPTNPSYVYANTGEGAGTVWRSTDGGMTYVRRSTTSGTGAGWYYNAVWVDPTNPEFILAGGYRAYKSTNGGLSLTEISDGYILTATPHPDIHAFVHDPGFNGTTNKRVYICTDGGVHRTEDIYTAADGVGWVSLQPTYAVTQFYGAAGDGPSGRIVGGTQDNGTLRVTTSSGAAVLTFGGDGGFCAIDPTNPQYTYGEYIALQVHRSSNGGLSANYIYQGISEAGTGAPNFIAPFILDPNQPARMLAGGVRLWRTNNARTSPVTWTAISPGWGATPISAIAVAPGNPEVVWVGLNDGRVMRTLNATAASPVWEAVDDNASADPLPDRYVTRVLLGSADGSVAYVCFGGFSPDNLYRTANGGGSWADLTGAGPTGLPDAPIRGIARHPADPQRLYVGTEVGVFATASGGQAWSTANQGPANVSVDELVFMNGSTTLLAATHGRGMWTTPVLTCTADWDRQGGVTSADISAFLTAWLASVQGGTLEADFNGDMTVNSTDISLFLGVWLEQVGLGC